MFFHNLLLLQQSSHASCDWGTFTLSGCQQQCLLLCVLAEPQHGPVLAISLPSNAFVPAAGCKLRVKENATQKGPEKAINDSL